MINAHHVRRVIVLAAVALSIAAACHKDKPEPVYPPVTSITLNKTDITLLVHKNDHGGFECKPEMLVAKVEPSDANPEVVWECTVPDDIRQIVAIVDRKGVVLGLHPGTAVVTATAKDDPSKKATCTVTVNDY